MDDDEIRRLLAAAEQPETYSEDFRHGLLNQLRSEYDDSEDDDSIASVVQLTPFTEPKRRLSGAVLGAAAVVFLIVGLVALSTLDRGAIIELSSTSAPEPTIASPNPVGPTILTMADACARFRTEAWGDGTRQDFLGQDAPMAVADLIRISSALRALTDDLARFDVRTTEIEVAAARLDLGIASVERGDAINGRAGVAATRLHLLDARAGFVGDGREACFD